MSNFKGFAKGKHMAEKENNKNEVYHLTKNVIEHSKILGIRKRNIVEAVVFTFLILAIVNAIPFTRLVKIISSLILGGFSIALNLRGIKHRSVTEVVAAEIKFRKRRRRLHLRGPEYVRQKFQSDISETEDESIAERYFKRIKAGIGEFVERYGEEEDSNLN